MINFLNNPTEIQSFCQNNNIAYLALFGSYARGDETDKSDVDLLVGFEAPVSFFELARIEGALEEKVGLPVDLVTKNGLSRHIEPYVVQDLIKLYEKS